MRSGTTRTGVVTLLLWVPVLSETSPLDQTMGTASARAADLTDQVPADSNEYMIIGGADTYEIVVDVAAPSYLDFAADELVDYLCRIIGHPGAIWKTSQLTPGHKGIFLRHSTALPPGGYTIAFDEDRHLYIDGHNEYPYEIRKVLGGGALPSGRRCYLGTLNGVYSLLRQLGCEWYFPGELGTIVPTASTVTVTAEAGAPFFKYVKPHRGQKEDGDAFDGIWALRHGACNIHGIALGHTWGTIMGLTQEPPPISEPDRRDFWWRDCADVDPSSDGEPLRCGHPEYMAMVPPDTLLPRPATHMDYHGLNWHYEPLAEDNDRFPDGPYDPFANRFMLQPYEVYNHYGGQACTSNPGVVMAFVDNIRWQFNRDPYKHGVSISPNDGANYCDCIQCRALDGSRDRALLYGDINGDGLVDSADERLWNELPSDKQDQIDIGLFTWTDPDAIDDSLVSYEEDPLFAGGRHLTDRLLTFYDQVASQIQLSHPDKKLGAYLYTMGRNPPRRSGYTLSDNLALILVHNSAYRLSDLQFSQDLAREQYWNQLHPGHVGCYDIAGWMSMGTPQPLGQGLVNRIKSWQQNNFLGALLYLGGSESQLGLDAFLFARLMWDPDQDVDALRAEYFADLYGNSGNHIGQFTDIIAERRQALAQDLHTQPNPAELRGISPHAAQVAYACDDSRLDGLIQQALQQPNDPTTEQRLQRVAENWEYAKAVSETIYAVKRLTEVPLESAIAEWELYKGAVDRQVDYLATLNAEAVRHIKFDTEQWLAIPWFDPGHALHTLPDNYVGAFEMYPAGETLWYEGYDQVNDRAYWSLNYANASHDVVQRDGEICLRCISGEQSAFASLVLGPDILAVDFPGPKWIQYIVTFKLENLVPNALMFRGNVVLFYRSYQGSVLVNTRKERFISIEDCRDWITTGFYVQADHDVDRIEFKLHADCRGELIIKDAKWIAYLVELDPVPGDFNGDADVDQEDFSRFEACRSGPSIRQDDPDCQNALLDADGDVDQDDFGIFQRCMSGPDILADPSCADQ